MFKKLKIKMKGFSEFVFLRTPGFLSPPANDQTTRDMGGGAGARGLVLLDPGQD